MKRLLIGPLVGLESEDSVLGHTRYTICFLADDTVSNPRVEASCGAITVTAHCVKTGTPNRGNFWRANINIPIIEASGVWQYTLFDESSQFVPQAATNHSFYVPGKNEKARFAFASCNGFASAKLACNTTNHYALWETMLAEQKTLQTEFTQPISPPSFEKAEDRPLSLLMLGGDQIYADSLFEKGIEELNAWIEMSREEQINYLKGADSTNPELIKLRKALDEFYFNLYLSRWGTSGAMAQIFATVPTVMMWDDHDIFDGWGSFSKDLMDCTVFQAVFAAAKKYFELFQVRGPKNQSLQNTGLAHYGLKVVFRDFNFVVMDGRSSRTIKNVLSEQGKIDFCDAVSIDSTAPSQNLRTLVVIIGLPLVYRRFSESELVRWGAERTQFTDSNYDDILDHWNFKNHRSELCSIINTLMKYQTDPKIASAERQPRVLVLSGDVHVGCAGTIREVAGPGRISQVVSSGIVHPAPNWFEWAALNAISSSDPFELPLGDGKRVQLSIEEIPGASDTFIRSRNFVRINHGSDGKLWANWRIEEHLLKDGTLNPEASQIALAC